MKQRYINTKFWSDNWISNLDPIEKLLFIYLLTNERTNIAGVYELPIKYMALETGIEKEMVEKILRRFEKDGKMKFIKSWVIIANFIEHQALNPKIEKGIVIIIQNEIPDYVRIELFKLNKKLEYYEDVYLPESRLKNIRNIIKIKDLCNSCKQEFPKENLVAHHKIPLYDGGNNEKENLSILCESCHKDIHNKIGYDRLSKASNYSNTNTNIINIIGKKADSSHHRIFSYYLEAVKKEYGIDPDFKGSVDGKMVQRTLKKYGEEKVKKILDYYLQSEKCKKFGFDLSTALSSHTINMYLKDNEALL